MISFVRDTMKSQEYSLRPLCLVWNSAVKGFSCGHLSGRDIMILQLNTESWDLFISTNFSPRCAEHIKYHRGTKKKRKKINISPNHNYRSINRFITMTSYAIHIKPYCQEQCCGAVIVSIKSCIYTSSVTSRVSKMTAYLFRSITYFH